MESYGSIKELLNGESDGSIHIECGKDISHALFLEVKDRFADKRCAYLMAEDPGYSRESIYTYLKLFARIANTVEQMESALHSFGLKEKQHKRIKACSKSEMTLIHFARMSLLSPEVCFCERPLTELASKDRRTVLSWMEEQVKKGTVFICTIDPLRVAMLLPGKGFWYEDGRFIAIEVEQDNEADEVWFAGDEIQVCKISARSDNATLLFDPRDIDFVESMNKTNYVSVRGNLYQSSLTMDELEATLVRFGFFRCHRSYIVNVQRVARVERYTRNSFNLTLNDVNESSIPLAKGRAEEMRELCGW